MQVFTVRGLPKIFVERRIAVIRSLEMKKGEFAELILTDPHTWMRRSELGILTRTKKGEKRAFNLIGGVLVEKEAPSGIVLTGVTLCIYCKGSGGSHRNACDRCDGRGIDADNMAIVGSEWAERTEDDTCRRCVGTGAFITGMENGKPTGPPGYICKRCQGRGKQVSCGQLAHLKRPAKSKACCDVARNLLFDYYRTDISG